jgi:hypothetical protein
MNKKHQPEESVHVGPEPDRTLERFQKSQYSPLAALDSIMKRSRTPSADSQSSPLSRSTGGSVPLLCTALLVLANTGCTTLFGRKGGPGDDLDLSQIKREGYTVGPNGVMQAAPSDETSVVLEVVDSKRHFEKIPLIQGQSMFIADVVKDADLRKKLGPIHVRILRPNGNGAPVRMDVDFDDSGKRVKDGTNYSLRPGDHIVVTKDDRGFASQMLSKSPLSGLLR